MNDADDRIREAILKRTVEDWVEQENPFSDYIFEQTIIPEVATELGEDIDRNDVEYVWKVLTDNGYFRKRGNARRITAKEIDEAEKLGVQTPLNEELQEEILKTLANAERQDVSHPEVSRDELINRLDAYDEKVIDYNLFYCRSKGWADVGVYFSEDPWQHAEITKFGRELAPA